ncbi:hypothetical protein ACA910_017779 [Epithemia clementina (nom. ined.)]
MGKNRKNLKRKRRRLETQPQIDADDDDDDDAETKRENIVAALATDPTESASSPNGGIDHGQENNGEGLAPPTRDPASESAPSASTVAKTAAAKTSAPPSASASSLHNHKTKHICDLFVPLRVASRKASKSEPEAQDSDWQTSTSPHVERKMLLRRLEDVGFTHVAFAHTVYGVPNAARDRADDTLPLKNENVDVAKASKSIKVLRRLHVVVENLSDVGLFVKPMSPVDDIALRTGNQKSLHELFGDYDLISLAPGNDVSFQAACSNATAAEIITLDYTAKGSGSGGGLPYRIRSADVRAAVARNAVFEIPYAPAILHAKFRRKLIQCCREFHASSAGLKPRIVVSSGPRTCFEKDGRTIHDALDMAIRTPGDIKNLLCTVLQFNDKNVSPVFTSSCDFAISKGLERRCGNAIIRDVQYVSMASHKKTAGFKPQQSNGLVGGSGISTKRAMIKADKLDESGGAAKTPGSNEDESVAGDGFISF